MIRNSVPLFFIFSLTATLLLPSCTHHVNFNTWSGLQGKKSSNRGSATAIANIVGKECSSRSIVTRSLLGTDHSANQTVVVSTTDNATATATACWEYNKICNTNTTSSRSAALSSSQVLQSPSPPTTSILKSPRLSLPPPTSILASPRHSPPPPTSILKSPRLSPPPPTSILASSRHLPSPSPSTSILPLQQHSPPPPTSILPSPKHSPPPPTSILPSPRYSPPPSISSSPPSIVSSPPPTSLSPGASLSPTTTPTLVVGNHIIWKIKVAIGVASGVMGGFMIFIIICCFRYKSLTRLFKFCWTTKSNLDIEAFLKLHGAVAQKRYKFSEVKKMTNSFKDKLGQGGFGAVYKGNLPTGSPVAVKILNASKRNGEEFINEVASISRTSHVNIVTLLGFCLEGRKKALIYEFMVNGSLEKFIYKREPQTIASLSWENLYQISIGIARGLEYLHRGCNTRILHFDIKPHNILLDENFCPKISDFGLAKLCPRTESIISMSDTRGTMGYVAPEMFNRQFGGVSHKSDVYSYGMLLLEMVGGRRNINAEASHTSEIYFPYLVYKRLELDNDLRPDEVMSTEENEIAKRMTIVGLWCIQTFPNDRPTMSRVVDMLEGSMNSLEMPPKPMFSSPTRSATESSSSN